ncbi:hypothetical protein YC2023_007648 [Brassica napus]
MSRGLSINNFNISKALLAGQEDAKRDKEELNKFPPRRSLKLRPEPSRREGPPHRREDFSRQSQSGRLRYPSTDRQSCGTASQRNNHREPYQRGRSYLRQEWQPRGKHSRDRYTDASKKYYEPSRGESHSAVSPKNRHARQGSSRNDEMRSQERTPISARLGPRNVEPSSQERVPVADRLGPTNNETMEMEPLAYTTVKQRSTRAPSTERLGPVPVENATTRDLSAKEPTLGGKRKPGRPPGSRNTAQNMGPSPESSSRKRKARAEKPPTGRKTTAPDTVRPRKVSKTAKNRRSVSARHHGKVQATLAETRRSLTELVLEPLRADQYYESNGSYGGIHGGCCVLNAQADGKHRYASLAHSLVVFLYPCIVGGSRVTKNNQFTTVGMYGETDPEEMKRTQEELRNQGGPSLSSLLPASR